MRLPGLLWGLLLGLAASAAADAAAQAGKDFAAAAALYHQGRFDSALASLEIMHPPATWKKRDSLGYFQYLGMASARLGRDSAAVLHFRALLGLDSLFQFPSNEDPVILKDFALARQPEAPAAPPAPGEEEEPEPIASAHEVPAPRSVPEMPALPPPFATPMPLSELPRMNLVYGALPLGTGWIARKRVRQGMTQGFIQAGSLLLSLYASERQSQIQHGPFGVKDPDALDSVERWQWVQRLSLSTALGAYLFSIIASWGD